MMKIWSMKQTAAAEEKKKPRTSAAQIRVQKDLTEMSLPSTMSTHFPDPENLLDFELSIRPDEGLYKGGLFKFSFHVNGEYPHEPPKVKCLQRIYHPNIDLDGNVCLNILREDWKPVLNLNSIVVGLQFLFIEPNPADPLNKDAAAELTKSRDLFKRHVRETMLGGGLGGVQFDRVWEA